MPLVLIERLVIRVDGLTSPFHVICCDDIFRPSATLCFWASAAKSKRKASQPNMGDLLNMYADRTEARRARRDSSMGAWRKECARVRSEDAAADRAALLEHMKSAREICQQDPLKVYDDEMDKMQKTWQKHKPKLELPEKPVEPHMPDVPEEAPKLDVPGRAPVFADVEKITGLQPAQALDLLRSVLTSLNSIVSAQPQAAPVLPATGAGVGPLSYAGALTAAPILPEVGTSAAAAAADEIQRLRQQLVGVTAHLEAAQNEAVRVRAELSEMESLQDRQNVVVSGEQGVAAIRSQSDRPVVNRNSGTSAALPAPGVAPALSGTVAPVAPLSGRQTPLSQVAPPANATLAAPVPMSRVKIPGPDKWTDQCLATSRVAEIFCEDLEVHCAYLRIDPADALPNFLTGKAREVWYPATRNAHILAHGARPTWAHLRASFKEMAGDDLRNESDVHRRKLLDPNALRMSAGSTLNAYITDFRNTLTVAGSTCMAPAMLVATFIRGLTSELQSSVVHDLALMRDPTLNDAIQAAVNAQKVLFAVATNHVGRRPPAPHVAAFVPPKQMNRLRTPPGLAGGPPPAAPRGPYWNVSSSSSSGDHRGSRHSSQGGGRHAGRAAQAPPATAPVCPAPAAGGSTLPIPGYACHHCWNPNHFRDYCNLKHLPADEARRVSGYPRPASLGPPSRHANPPGDLPPRSQKRDRSPPGKGGWKQQSSRGDRRR
ncbi:hypothetical protein QJQ45_015045 [Haematococcus lacustris]|nr:hypothetical protein QJQ45_015045 [Haematococcus lacustris]